MCLGKVQFCIWPSWCHCHPLCFVPVNPYWCRLTWVVSDKIQQGRKMVVCVWERVVIACHTLYINFFLYWYVKISQNLFFYFTPVGLQVMNCDVSVRLSVCLSACVTQKPCGRISPNFLCMLSVAVPHQGGSRVGAVGLKSLIWFLYFKLIQLMLEDLRRTNATKLMDPLCCFFVQILGVGLGFCLWAGQRPKYKNSISHKHQLQVPGFVGPQNLQVSEHALQGALMGMVTCERHKELSPGRVCRLGQEW